ncbi:hypothetical protein DCO44_16405 [Acinetobacter sp. AM]|uniref:zonular occludens toxin domain-containing protein n=1 Tax=Acinetobacter sp. AM TaxID=2170730 RepID=UPI000DE6B742|nr:zonular occludens toxin domain-containing protein [Acinetobacter sp. AM]PWB12986.1 hypothetical protein DCO44_16405 [Acinetobacter sp. AM]
MLHLVTGTPGSQKTAFTVNKLDQIEKSNFINVRKNKIIFENNKKLFEQFKEEFLLYMYEVGSGSDIKTEIEMLPDDYFDFLNEDFDDLRPDDYFKKTTRYNEIVDRINDSYGKQDFQFLQPVRTIYTNIKACKIPYSRPLIYDWRDAPDGSIIVIDEIQLVEPYKNKKSEDEMIMHLTIHRHRGFDFYIITQATRYLHPVMKELFTVHYHLTRPFGWTCRVYQYGSARDNPNALVNKINCESKTSFKPADRIFTLYKSTTIDTSQKRIPKFIYFIGAFVIAMCFLFYHFASKDNVIVDQVTAAAKGEPPIKPTDANNLAPDMQKKVDLCMEQFKWTKDQCIQAYNPQLDQKQKEELAQKTGNSMDAVVKQYNPSKPFDDYSVNVSYEPTAKPVFSGCMKKNGKYVAYTQQGTILHDVSQADCKRVVEDGDRPFNYYAQQQQVVNTQQPQQQTTQVQQQLSAEDLAKFQQAKKQGLI